MRSAIEIAEAYESAREIEFENQVAFFRESEHPYAARMIELVYAHRYGSFEEANEAYAEFMRLIPEFSAR